MAVGTKYLAHHIDQLQGSVITYAIKDPIGILSGIEDAFIPQDRQVLGNIALGRADFGHDVVDADFFFTQGAKDLQSQWMGHGLERTRGALDVAIILHQCHAFAEFLYLVFSGGKKSLHRSTLHDQSFSVWVIYNTLIQ